MARLTELNLPPSAVKRFSFVRKARDGREVPCEVLIQILTPKENDLARAEALRATKALVATAGEKDERNAATFDELLYDAVIYETLAYALLDPDPKFDAEAKPPPWASAMELREHLSIVECGVIWRAYNLHEQWLGPVKHELTDEEYEAMLMIAAANDKLDPEALFGSRLRARCHHKMASELLSLRARLADATKAETERVQPDFGSMLIDPDDESETP